MCCSGPTRNVTNVVRPVKSTQYVDIRTRLVHYIRTTTCCVKPLSRRMATGHSRRPTVCRIFCRPADSNAIQCTISYRCFEPWLETCSGTRIPNTLNVRSMRVVVVRVRNDEMLEVGERTSVFAHASIEIGRSTHATIVRF